MHQRFEFSKELWSIGGSLLQLLQVVEGGGSIVGVIKDLPHLNNEVVPASDYSGLVDFVSFHVAPFGGKPLSSYLTQGIQHLGLVTCVHFLVGLVSHLQRSQEGTEVLLLPIKGQDS